MGLDAGDTLEALGWGTDVCVEETKPCLSELRNDHQSRKQTAIIFYTTFLSAQGGGGIVDAIKGYKVIFASLELLS